VPSTRDGGLHTKTMQLHSSAVGSGCWGLELGVKNLGNRVQRLWSASGSYLCDHPFVEKDVQALEVAVHVTKPTHIARKEIKVSTHLHVKNDHTSSLEDLREHEHTHSIPQQSMIDACVCECMRAHICMCTQTHPCIN
jgi:hypothetical protein